MEKDALLKILIEERNYHASHPVEISSKFVYSLGVTLTTIIAGVIFKEKLPVLKETGSSPYFIPAIILIGIGYVFIIIAIAEHTKFHKLQLNRLENAIEYLIHPREDYSYEQFWEKFGEKLHRNERLMYEVKLIAKEPDVRKGFRFHDRKIELGIYLILAGAIMLIGLIVNAAA